MTRDLSTFMVDKATQIGTELAEAVSESDPTPERLVRMTALLHMLRKPGSGLVEVVDALAALDRAGVRVRAVGSATTPKRRDVLVLSRGGAAAAEQADRAPEDPSPSGDLQAPWIRQAEDWPASTRPIWVDLGSQEPSERVLGRLASDLPGFDPQAARHMASMRAAGDAVVLAEDPEQPRGLWFAAALASGDGAQVLMPRVGFLVGTGWLVTFWATDTVGGHPATLLRSAVMSRVARRRSDGSSPLGPPGPRSAGDVALVALETLVDTYDRSTRDLDAELSRIESTLVLGGADAGGLPSDVAHLVSALGRVLASSTRMRHALSGLRRARLESYDRSWFPDVSDHAGRESLAGRTADLVTLLDTRLEALDDLQSSARSVLQLAEASESAARARRSERLDESVRLITGVVLVPTLVAAVYGANVAVPGGSSWWGTVIMVALMVAGGAFGWFWLTYRK